MTIEIKQDVAVGTTLPIYTIKKGTRLEVLDVKGAYYQVEYNGLIVHIDKADAEVIK